MSKFDLMSGSEPIEVQIIGSVKTLRSILDQEIKAGYGGKNVRLKIEHGDYGIFDVVQSNIGENEWVTVIWVETDVNSYCASTVRDQLKIATSTGKIAVVLREAIMEKDGYGYGSRTSSDKFKLAGCRVTGIDATAQGVMITAEPMGKFKGIKTFLKDLESSGAQ